MADDGTAGPAPSGTDPAGPPRRTQEARSAETRARLIRAAIDLICRDGYANVTTTAIAEAAGVSRGALQHHFRTRYDLIEVVNGKLTDDMLTLGEELEAGRLPLDARVARIVDHYFSVYTGAAYLAILNISLGARDDGMHESLRREFADIYRKSDTPWLRLFGDSGLAPGELAALRRMTLATLRGLALARFLDIQQGPAEAELDLLKAVLTERVARGRDNAAAG